MAPKNMLEATLGIRFQSSLYWESHPLVGLSSLFYAVPSATALSVNLCIWAVLDRSQYTAETLVHNVLYVCLALLYAGVIATSALADYIYIRRGHRSYFGKVDIWVASATFFVSLADYSLRASVAQTCLLVAIAMGAFLLTGSSPSPQQWVVRHTMWHAIGAADATYGVLHLMPEEKLIGDRIWSFLWCAYVAYTLAIGAALAAWFSLPEARRRAIWEMGAAHANWKAVPVEPRTPLNGIHRKK